MLNGYKWRFEIKKNKAIRLVKDDGLLSYYEVMFLSRITRFQIRISYSMSENFEKGASSFDRFYPVFQILGNIVGILPKTQSIIPIGMDEIVLIQTASGLNHHQRHTHDHQNKTENFTWAKLLAQKHL